MPSSRRVAHTWAGVWSQNRSEFSVATTASRSGRRQRPVAARSGPSLGRRAGAAVPVERRSGVAQRPAGGLHSDGGGEFFDGGVENGISGSSESALLESSSKSACTFPCTSMTTRALASCSLSRSFSALSLATSDSDGPPRPPSVRPSAALRSPWRCWRRQSVIRLEYEPFPPQEGALLALLGAPVVLGQDGQLVVRREHPPHRVFCSGVRRHAPVPSSTCQVSVRVD